LLAAKSAENGLEGRNRAFFYDIRQIDFFLSA
jgi:hypothetical protein